MDLSCHPGLVVGNSQQGSLRKIENKVHGTAYLHFLVQMMLKEHSCLLSCLPTFTFLPSSFGFDLFRSLCSTSSTLRLTPEEPVYLQHTNLYLFFFCPFSYKKPGMQKPGSKYDKETPPPPNGRAHVLPKGKQLTHKTASGATSAGCCFNRSDLLLL